MPDLALVPPPPARELRRLLRAALARIEPDLQVLAEDVAGLDGRVDLVAAEPGGRVALLLCERGRDRGLELVAEGLSQCAVIAERLSEWSQLAPHLELDVRRPPRLVLLAARFGPKAVAAARASGAHPVDLVEYRCIRSGGEVGLLLERFERLDAFAPTARSKPPEPVADQHGELSDGAADEPPSDGWEPVSLPGRRDVPPSTPFRTGLTDADLQAASARREDAD